MSPTSCRCSLPISLFPLSLVLRRTTSCRPPPAAALFQLEFQLKEGDVFGKTEKGSAAVRDTDMSDASVDDHDLQLALQLSVQEGAVDQSNQQDMTKLLGDQSFVSSILASLPGVDPNDPQVKDLLASMQSETGNNEEDKTGDKPPKEDEKK